MNTLESGPRDFMPGECTGASAETFEMIDQGHDQQVPRLLAAIAICRNSCPQLRFCEEQRTEITTTLGARGVEYTVVGGEIVTPLKAENTYDAHLYEPNFKFDLSHVPPNNRHKLEVIRQGLRVGQLSLRGLQAASHADLAARLSDRLSASHNTALTERNITPISVSAFVASAMLRYAIAQHPGDRAFKRNASLNDDEIRDAEAVQLHLTEDILALKDAGALNPLDIAKYHKPELFLAVHEKYKSGFELTPGEVRKVFYESPFRPLVAAIKLATKKRKFRTAKDTRNLMQKGEIVPREVSESVYIASKLTLLKKTNVSIRYIASKPNMRRYISDIIRNNSDNPAEKIQELHGRIKVLQKEHPDVDIIALSHIAYHHSDNPEAAMGIFRNALAEINHAHRDNQDLGSKLRQRLAFEHMNDAPGVAEMYLERLEQIRELYTASSIDASDNFKKQYALEFRRPIVGDEITEAYDKFQSAIYRNRKFKELPIWLRKKIVELHDEEDQIQIAQNTAMFVHRKYLQTKYVAEPTDAELPYDRIDPKNGAYLAWSEDFTYLKPEEQKAILCVFGLERLVLGKDVDEAALGTYFKTADLSGYVDKHLLPHTVHPDHNSQANESMLETLRRAIRDHRSKGEQGRLKTVEQAKRKELFEQLLMNLVAEQPRGHDLNDPEVRKRLNSLVRRAISYAPQIMNNPRLLLVTAKEFLSQASTIRALGARMPYYIATGYSSDFCNNFLMRAKRELPDHPKGIFLNFLERTTTGQAMTHLRRYQNLVSTMSLEFSRRRIPPSYCRDMCKDNIHNPEIIMDRLRAYDEVRKYYASNHKVSSSIIRYFCFNKTTDPFKEVDDWRTEVNNIDANHIRRIGWHSINWAALTKRGKELTDYLDDRLEEFETYRAHYQKNPHPAIDDDIIHFATFHGRSNPGNVIKNYIKRWRDIHNTEDLSDIKPKILRRIIAVHVSNPRDAIKDYRKLSYMYQNDPYIQQWMVDEAIQYGIGKAFTSLANMRRFMMAREVRLDNHRNIKGSHGEKGSSDHELIADPAPSIHEQLFGPDDQEFNDQKQARDKGLISKFLEKARPMEKAAIAIAYDIPWLMPQDMSEDDEDKIYSFYQVETLEDLKEQVSILLSSKSTDTSL